MTLNILKYVRKILNLKTLVCLYQRFLDYLNITYIIAPITSFRFEDLNFLIPPKISNIGNIKKTMIFIDSIEKNRALIIYLQIFLQNNLKNKSKNIIKSFSLILEVTTKTD